MILKKIILLFSIFLVGTFNAQDYFLKNYNVENGLPFVQVACMYQSSNGYLWIGGYGGLSRFDGKTFLNYNKKSGLLDHNVNTICEANDGKIYVGTNKGLSAFDGKRFQNFSEQQGLNNEIVTAICKGYHNKIYVGTNSGLFMFRNDSLKEIKKFQHQKIRCLFNPDTSLIFIGTDKGLFIYGHNTFIHLNKDSGLCANEINSISFFKRQLVVATSNGLSFISLKDLKIINYHSMNGLIDENIITLHNQKNEILWLGSNSGVMCFDGKAFSYFNISSDINSNQLRSAFNDRENNMWFGTNNGLFKYRDKSFTTFDRKSGLGSSFIFQIFRDKQNDLWVCSQNTGIYREHDGYFKKFGIHAGLNSLTSHSGLQTKTGHLLFGTGEELLEFKNEKFYAVDLPKECKPPYEIIYEAKNGLIWIGGANGIASLNFTQNKTEAKFYPIQFDGEFGVYGFCEDDENNLYVGTFKAGLYKFSNNQFENLTEKYKLNEENFFALRYYQNYVIGASLNGLIFFNTKTHQLKHINDIDGLNSELIYSIEFTNRKNALWIGTNQGINKLNLKKYVEENKIEISSFGKQEGFAGVECNSNGIWEDNDGTVWFGTVSGLVKHQPQFFKKNKMESITLIQNIKVLNEDTLLENNSTLPSDYNTIEFYYHGICLTNPDKVLYQKKLEGLKQDKDWSEPGKEEYIKYTNLSPGKYTFRVRSCNNEGLWSKETKFSFSIKTPFYQTWWFYLLATVLAIGLAYLIFSIRVYNFKKKQKIEFERKVEMSKTELKALRAQMNPHFIFNSLNAIQHYIFNTRSDEAVKYLNKFAKLVREILNNSDKPTVTIGEDLEALKLYLELEHMRFEEKFDFEVIVRPEVDLDYDIMPPLLMQPYVENAILHGINPLPHKGKLIVELDVNENFLICKIKDNGIGREKSKEIKRTMPGNKHKSFGMKITEDRLKILNEINNSKLSVTITDLKDEAGIASGTQVELYIPTNN